MGCNPCSRRSAAQVYDRRSLCSHEERRSEESSTRILWTRIKQTPTLELVDYFYENDKPQLAEYALAQCRTTGVFSTMEVDPLPEIARDLFNVVERRLGKDDEQTKDFVERLAQYMPDFAARYFKERQQLT